MKKIKLLFLLISIIYGNSLIAQNDTIKPFLKNKFKMSFIDEMNNDSLALVTKPYLGKLFNKIRIQNELIFGYGKLNHLEYINKLTSLNEGLEKQITKTLQISDLQKKEIDVLKDLNNTTKIQVGLEKEKFNEINIQHKKEYRKNKLTLKLTYIAIPLAFILGVIIAK